MAGTLNEKARSVFVPKPHYPNVFMLGQRLASDHAYAPNDDKSLYFHLNEKEQRSVFESTTTAGCFVSVHFMEQLIKRNVDFGTIGQVSSANGVITPRNPGEKEEEPKDLKKRVTHIPFRNKKGELKAERSKFYHLKKPEDLLKAWRPLYQQAQKAAQVNFTASSKPSRMAAVPLHNGMIVVFEKDGLRRFTQDFINNSIDAVNQAAEKLTWKTMVRFEAREVFDQEGKYPDFFPYSISPFGFYTTYIHLEDWHQYMVSLEPNPIRRFPRQETKTMIDQKQSADAKIKRRRDAMDKLIENIGKEDQNGNVRNIHETKGATWAQIKQINARADSMWKDNGTPAHGICTEVSADKIANASGQRDKEESQKEVMRESAVQIAQSLGSRWHWKQVSGEKRNNGQMSNGLYIAELTKTNNISLGGKWLHLCAFSWGGLIGLGTEDQGATSQVPENLVLGTSETNSLMMRYEQAWQNLFTHETKLQRKLFGDGFQIPGYITVDCNVPEAMVVVDVVDKGMKYRHKVCRFDRVETPWDHALATKYSFIASVIDYKVAMGEYSHILGANGTRLHTYFWPFCRPFYHKAEGKLDELLFKELLRQAEERIQDYIANNGVRNPNARQDTFLNLWGSAANSPLVVNPVVPTENTNANQGIIKQLARPEKMELEASKTIKSKTIKSRL